MNELTIGASASLGALLHSADGEAAVFSRDIFLIHLPVVGTRYLGDAEELIGTLKEGSELRLLHETENQFDERAIMVLDQEGHQLGYLPRNQNAVLCALLDAGKPLYGKVCGTPRRVREEEETSPYELLIDVYMRDHAAPGDISGIPPQGYDASYAVVTMAVTDTEVPEIASVYALKIINGEEVGGFSGSVPADGDDSEYRELLEKFDRFAGFLPLVGHNIEDAWEKVLSERYGVLLGKAFSNVTIDTENMAKIHLPGEDDYSLTHLAALLGIRADGVTKEEETCRATWELYRKMERTELETVHTGETEVEEKRSRQSEEESSIRKYGRLVRETGLSAEICESLQRGGIDTVRELCQRSEAEIACFYNMTPSDVEDVKAHLKKKKLCLRPAYEWSALYGYPDYIKKIAEEKADYWDGELFIEMLILQYGWLKKYVRQKPKLWQTGSEKTDHVKSLSGLRILIEKKLRLLEDILCALNLALNADAQELMKAPQEEGFVEKTAETVASFAAVYKDMVRWRMGFESVDADQKYRKAIELLLHMIDGAFESMEKWKQKLYQGREIFSKVREGKEENPHIDLYMEIQLKNSDAFSKELNRLIKEES